MSFDFLSLMVIIINEIIADMTIANYELLIMHINFFILK